MTTTSPRMLMLDSGAFTVWSRGTTVDLDAYIQFCLTYPNVTSYVSLDVIPGKPRDRRSMTPSAIAQACEEGWRNYQRMLECLPKEKVVPVFHQNDNISWLKKYLDFGTPYLGISPANDRTTAQKLAWLRDVRKVLCGPDGNPRIKIHGFAVTSYRLMKFWNWYSVDSASWMAVGAYGGVYVPKRSGGQWDYSVTPLIIAVSPKSPAKHDFNAHYNSLSPIAKKQVQQYFEENGTAMGEFSIDTVEPGYTVKRDIPSGELWYDRTKNQVMRAKVPGLSTSCYERWLLNSKFIKRANEVLPVDHIYFAGNVPSAELEKFLNRRLMSYHFIYKENRALALFHRHNHAVQRYNERCESIEKNCSAV